MRLTKKHKDLEGIYSFEGLENIEEGACKLGQLEDIEDEFKINAKIVLLCALHQNIFIKDLDDYRRHYIKYGHVFFKYKNKTYILPYEDYGKTWALTRKGLK